MKRSLMSAALAAFAALTSAQEAFAAANTIVIAEKAGVSTTNYPIQLGRPFLAGEIPAYPQALVNGVPVLTQADVKSRWPDGSVKHAVLAFLIPTLPAGGSVSVGFQNQPSGNNTGGLSAAAALNGPYDFDALMQLVSGAAALSASARAMLQAGAYAYWLQGPVATSFIIADHSAARAYDMGFDANKAFRPIFHATFWPGINKVRVRFIGEISNTSAFEDQTYDLTLKTGLAAPATVYTKAAVLHAAGSRWTKEFWIGGAPAAISINHNVAYLAQTKFIPNYDPSKAVPESAVASAYSTWTGAAKEIYDAGNWTKSMGTTGGRPDIGPYPNWTVQWLYTGDNRLREQAFGNADLAAAWPMHFREGAAGRYFDRAHTVPAIGKILSLSARPTIFTGDGNGYLTYSGTNANDKIVFVGPVSNGGWRDDGAHQPDPFSPQYALTGDYWYLEQMWFWAAWSAADVDPGSVFYGRGPSGEYGGIHHQTRGEAWIFRSRAVAAFMSPDNSPEKAYFETLINDAVAIWEGVRDIRGTAFENNTAWTWGNTVGKGLWAPQTAAPTLHMWQQGGTGYASNSPSNPAVTLNALAPWQQNFMMFSLGRAKELGYPTGALVSWLAYDIIGILTDPGFGIPWAIAAYVLPTTKIAGPQYFQTFTELRTGYDPTYNFQSNFTGTTSDTNHGYALIALAAASMVAAEPGGAAAWNFMAQNALTSAALNNNPKWAILPRSIGGAPPAAPPPASPKGLGLR